jgi:hypothetical protein
VAPLTTLLNKEAFSWTQEATKSFEKLEDIRTTHFLATLDFKKHLLWSVMPQTMELVCFKCKKEGTLPFKEANLKEKTYSNQFMKNKCWSYYMLLRNGALT